MEWFRQGIKDMLKVFVYSFYIVQQDFNVDCSCVDYTTKQADPACKKCLGTGNKIYIREIEGALEDRSSTFQNINVRETSSSHIYYIDGKYPVFEKNIIVDGDDITILHRVDRKRTTGKETVYYKCYAVPKKVNKNIFVRTFQEIIKKQDKKNGKYAYYRQGIQ